jgi:outer membrane murein-binding lipoprotein Lpp
MKRTLIVVALCLLGGCAAQHVQLTPQDVQELTAQWDRETLPDLLAEKK